MKLEWVGVKVYGVEFQPHTTENLYTVTTNGKILMPLIVLNLRDKQLKLNS